MGIHRYSTCEVGSLSTGKQSQHSQPIKRILHIPSVVPNAAVEAAVRPFRRLRERSHLVAIDAVQRSELVQRP